MIKSTSNITSAIPVLLAAVFMYAPSPAQAQDWPASMANQQVEFDLDESELAPVEERTLEVTRGQVGGDMPTIEEPTVSRIIRRDIINPFDTDEVEAAPAMQMLPEDIIIPELPDAEIQQQINLDEFRNYLQTLIENPPLAAQRELSQQEVKKQLSRIDISTLMTSPNPFVVINGQRFTVGDRFSVTVNMPKQTTNMERLIQEQMPRKGSVPEEVYNEFAAIKDEALAKYRTKQAQRQSDTNANTHNISVIISDIGHRKLQVSVDGREYIIPIRMSL